MTDPAGPVGALLSYGAYLPRGRLDWAEVGATLGSGGGRGTRVVASFDEDSTTMGLEAARTALSRLRPVGQAGPEGRAGTEGLTGTEGRAGTEGLTEPALTGRQAWPGDLYFATTSPAYLDKTNAAAIHTALGLGATGFAADLAGSARSGIAALRAAAAQGGIAVLSDVRTGQPGSADERAGGDAAAAFVFGPPGAPSCAGPGDAAGSRDAGQTGDAGDGAIAHVVAQASVTAEVLDRWRSPAQAHADVWEERFGYEQYAPLISLAAAAALRQADVEVADHIVLVSPNAAVPRRGKSLVTSRKSTTFSPVGHAGAADAGVALASVLDLAGPDETILLLSAADGCDALVLRTTDLLPVRRPPVPVDAQLKAANPVPYASYLTWRGQLVREPPRRPEPDRPAAPPSARGGGWKFAFTGSRCEVCGFVHLPPARVCHRCGAVDQMSEARLADTPGTVATYTVDRLAFSPSPPLVDAVVNFDGGGRSALEVADADPDALAVGARVGLVFRRLYTAGAVHNYFWKARVLAPGEPGFERGDEAGRGTGAGAGAAGGDSSRAGPASGELSEAGRAS